MKPADIILKSSAIFRGCVALPTSGIVAIRGNKIQFIGEEAELAEYQGPHTRIYDFGDQLIMPGVHDAHLHFYMSGLYASPYVQMVTGETSEEACVERMKEAAGRIPKDRWLIGAGWFHHAWDNPVMPTKKSLDRVFPDRPVCMVSLECHSMWFNSVGLEKAGIRKDSTPPKGGIYDRLKNGELAGTVHEAAAFGLLPKVYTFPQEEEDAFYSEFVKKLNSYGITSVCDMSMMPQEGADFVRDDIYERLLRQEKLNVRVNMYPTLRMDLSRPLEMREKYDGQILRCQGVKQFMDGVSSCHTAYLKEPYTNAYFDGDCGRTTIPVDEMREMILNAAKHDLSVRIHAIGDMAIHELLDIFEEAEQRYGYKPELQHTLEHLENFLPEDIGRLAKVHVLPSVQPPHLVLDMEGIERDLGEARIKDMWPFRRMIDTGSTIAFGTDSPVVECNPFYGIYNAVTRKNVQSREPDGGWMPEEKITLAEALSSYTYGSACAASRADAVGTLAPGKLADIAVLDRNLFKIDPEEIPDTCVVMTIMDGKIVYQK